MPSAREKAFPFFPALLVLAAAGGLAVVAVRFYRHPWETFLAVIRGGLLMAGIREETCNLDGVAMHYYCAGRRGTPIVLIHGLGSSAETWAALIPLLSREYLVYAPDMPGFGKTPLAPEGATIGTHVLYLQRFLDALGYPRVTLVGNSMAGWIATRFALAHPERVERLFLLNSAGLRREGMHRPYAMDRAPPPRTLDTTPAFSSPAPIFILDAVVRESQIPAYTGFIRT